MSLKRLFDLAVASVALICLSPILLFLACFIRWQMGPPVLFIQSRVGLHGKPFKLVKFRTMSTTNSNDTDRLSAENRITPLGRYLRSRSLDELPELWNVLRGEMSLVGPRPLLLEYLPLYSKFQSQRHDTKPGITGLAQIKGRNKISWEQKFELDVWYVKNATFLLDLKIILRTIVQLVKERRISGEGFSIPDKFTGPEK